MNESGSLELYQRNMALIGEIYPQYVSLLSIQSASESNYLITEIAPSTYSCRIRSSSSPMNADGWIHGPENPWTAAEQAIKNMSWSAQSLFLILRPSLGYLPLTLYPNLRKGRHAQRMLLAEDRVDLFRLSLRLFDWTDVLRSDRTILLLGGDPTQAAIHFFQTNPVSLLPPLSVLCGEAWNGETRRMMNSLQKTLSSLAETVFNASKQYFEDLKTHYAAAAIDAHHKKKIVMVEPEHDYLAASIGGAFREEGCIVETFQGNQRLLHFLNPYIWLVYTREHYPDVLLWMNRNTLSPEGVENLRHFPIKKVLWFLDSPKRVQTTREEIEASDFYFSFDPTYLPYLEELGGKKGAQLSTAAGIRPQPSCQPGENWPQRQGPLIGFVGALAAQRFQAVREYWLRKDPEFVAILDGVVEEYLGDPARSLEERFDASPGRNRLPYSGFVVLYLEERATYLRRLHFLQPLRALGLKTYGGIEWGRVEWAKELQDCFAGTAPRYLEDLPSVYYHSQINVNVFHVQCVNSSNPRVYDVLAAGGFLLTEYRPILEDEFKIGEHIVCFRDPEELRAQTEYYLQHEEERETIARAGQKFVLEHATYRQRIQRMLSEIAAAPLS